MHPFFQVGKNYFVRDGVDYWIGRCVELLPGAVVLEDCAWVQDTGRLHQFMANGAAGNMAVEPLGKVRHLVYVRSATEWPHKLFTKPV